LTITTNGKKYARKSDGEVTITPKTRYVCYNRTRHPDRCDGQTGYTTSRLDDVVEKVVLSIFPKIKEAPGEQVISKQFDARIAGIKLNLEQAKIALSKNLEELSMLEDELIKVLRGTSSLKPELLNKKHDEAERAVEQRRAIVESLEQELDNSKDTIGKFVLRKLKVKPDARYEFFENEPSEESLPDEAFDDFPVDLEPI